MRFAPTGRRGFTAIEIAMVASVIAILALLVLPIFRKRAEEARVVAAQDEIQSLVKAMLLVEADMPGGAFLPQLSDLDNRSNEALTTNLVPDLEPARVRWEFVATENRYRFNIIPEDEWLRSIVPNWKGPYIAVRNSISLEEISTSAGLQPLTVNFGQGPIYIPSGALATGTPWNATSLAADRYPIDPWGRPYMLFGSEETVYNVRSIFSLGPNGIPGPPDNNPTRPTIASDFNRRFGILGQGDDIEFVF